jgi:hypothetical protein
MKSAPFSISAFWRNDRPEGIAVLFHGGDNLAAIEHKIALACEEMDQPDHDHSAILLAQLAEYASRRDALSLDEKIDVACLIGALQHVGVIIADNFNGLMIIKGRIPIYNDEKIV